MITIFVPYLGPSLNEIYSGVHYRKRAKASNTAHWVTKIAVREMKPINVPVTLTFRPVLGKGTVTRDCSNYAYAAKMIEDGLVKAGILKDDTPEYVRSITIAAPVRDRDRGNGMFIDIDQIQESGH